MHTHINKRWFSQTTREKHDWCDKFKPSELLIHTAVSECQENTMGEKCGQGGRWQKKKIDNREKRARIVSPACPPLRLCTARQEIKTGQESLAYESYWGLYVYRCMTENALTDHWLISKHGHNWLKCYITLNFTTTKYPHPRWHEKF